MHFLLTYSIICDIIIISKVGINALSEKGTGSCLFYERYFICGIVSAFRCCNQILLPFCSKLLQKGFFIMRNLKNFFYLKKLTTRELCTLSLLLAISIILGIFFTIRPTPTMKIPTKFFPIAISSMLFGPLWGGLTGLLSDTVSYFLNQSAGAFMPQITFIEFLYGFTYGLFLRNIHKNNYIKGIIGVLFQIIFLHILLTTYFLVPVFNTPFVPLLISRLPAAGINSFLQLFGIIFIIKNSNTFRKLSGGDFQ